MLEAGYILFITNDKKTARAIKNAIYFCSLLKHPHIITTISYEKFPCSFLLVTWFSPSPPVPVSVARYRAQLCDSVWESDSDTRIVLILGGRGLDKRCEASGKVYFNFDWISQCVNIKDFELMSKWTRWSIFRLRLCMTLILSFWVLS